MTKHIRKEHPAESIQDDQDAEYSDAEPSDDEQLENDAEDYQEDSRTSYQKPDNAQEMSSSRPSSNYHASLWRLPAQTAQRPSPLRLQRPYIPRSDTTIQEIKLERSSSATPQRSLTDPYPNGQMSTSEYVNARADTMPDSIPVHPSMPQSLANGGLPQQYQLGSRESNIRIWNSQQSMQESPTSLTGSSPSSAGVHSHSLFPSQSYQHQNVEVPSHEHIQYSQHTDVSVQSSIHQPMADMTVHEITLDQPQHSQYRNVSQTPVQQHPYDRVQRQTPQQNLYNDMTREPSQHPTYSETPPQAPVSHYQDDVPPTPAPSQQLPHYTTSMPETPYQQPQFLPLESFSISNQYFPPNGGAFQYNEALDWWKEVKPEEIWEQLPSQRLQGFEWQ
ncbi:hypothetical protein MMC28_010186 [Mycoblastus sanguinarius]|nr:hypothetical protein [Mycoblastus sanguinarius]